MSNAYEIHDLGLTDYRQTYALQKYYVGLVKSARLKGALLFTEHKPIFTFGRSGDRSNMLISEASAGSFGIDILEVDRGGDVTFHGPGQLVTYPIFNLKEHQMDLHRYLREIEEVIIKSLRKSGIPSFRPDGHTGVWTKEGKIASIGIAVSRWISYHGFSVNANVDLRYFDMIHPCGLKDEKITSMCQTQGSKVDMGLLKQEIAGFIQEAFGCILSPPESSSATLAEISNMILNNK
ncbi:MAG: lipoyl(octanoyl) transferase LipB [Candidatus Omnitrophota bacterium]